MFYFFIKPLNHNKDQMTGDTKMEIVLC